jgi:hypothetical protein
LLAAIELSRSLSRQPVKDKWNGSTVLRVEQATIGLGLPAIETGC